MPRSTIFRYVRLSTVADDLKKRSSTSFWTLGAVFFGDAAVEAAKGPSYDEAVRRAEADLAEYRRRCEERVDEMVCEQIREANDAAAARQLVEGGAS